MSMIKVNSSNVKIESKKKEITTNVVIKKVDGEKSMDYSGRLFNKILACCGAGAFAYKNQPAKEDEYVIALCSLLIQKGVKDSLAVQAAINELQDKNGVYVPSPGEFVTMILRHQFGIGHLPPDDIAYKNACLSIYDDIRYKWQHDVIKETAIRTGFYNLKTKGKDDIFSEFKYYYKEVINELLSGGKIVFKVPSSPIFPEPPAVNKEEGAAAKKLGWRGLFNNLNKEDDVELAN